MNGRKTRHEHKVDLSLQNDSSMVLTGLHHIAKIHVRGVRGTPHGTIFRVLHSTWPKRVLASRRL